VSKDIKNLEKEVNILIHNQCSTDKVVTEYLTSRGNPYFERTTRTDKIRFNAHDKNQQKWYNKECKRKHAVYKQALNIYIAQIKTRTTEN